MKKLFSIVILLTATGVAFAAPVDNPNTSKNKAQSLSESFVDVPFASLGSLPAQYNGTVVYCPDCGTAVVCSGGGGPALALAINGTWNCQALSNTNAGGGGGSFSPLTATLDAAGHFILHVLKLTGNSIIEYANNATNALLGFSINGTYNPVAYGSDPTGVVDATDTDQATVDAACASTTATATATVLWPTGKFLHANGPILVACANPVNLIGQGRAATYWINDAGNGNHGFFLAEVPTGQVTAVQPITATSLVTGSGTDFAMNWGPANSQTQYMYDISNVWEMTISGTRHNDRLNGLSTATIDFFIKPIPNTSATTGAVYGIFRIDDQLTDILPSNQEVGYWTYNSGGTSTLTICVSTTGNPAPVNSNGNPSKCVTANVTNAVTSYVQFNYDGSLHLAVGTPGGTATFVAAVASSGTLINYQDDDFWLGRAGSDPGQFMSGQLDSFRVSNIVRNADSGLSTFTAPNAKFTSDGNTLALLNAPAIRNATVAGVAYPFAVKTTNPTVGWMIPYVFELPGGGGIGQLEGMTINGGLLDESINNTAVSHVTLDGGWFASYQGWYQAYSVNFEDVNFDDFNTLYQIRNDSNSFGVFNNLTIHSGYFQTIGTGGGVFSNVLEQVGGGTICSNTPLGKGDLFTGDVYTNIATDAEEGGNAWSFCIGQNLSKFELTDSAIEGAGTGSAMKFGGTPPNSTKIENTGIFGNLVFDTFLHQTTAGLGYQPVLLINDYTADGGAGNITSSVCSIPDACQIIGANTQFSRLGIQIGPPNLVATSGGNATSSVTTFNVNRTTAAQSGDMYVLTGTFFGADPGAFTLPSDWTQVAGVCSVSDPGPSSNPLYTRTFYHSANVADPSTWTFNWTNATSQNQWLISLVRGADQPNPVDTCFSTHGNSTTTVTLTGGTSTNINDLILNYVSVYTGTGAIPSVGATPPTGLSQYAAGGGVSNFAWFYTPASLTIPTVNYVLANSSQPWTALQVAVRSKTQSAVVLGNTASAHVMFQGMAGAQFQSASGLFVNTCKGDVTLSAGTGTFTNACVTTASACDARDITTPANLCVVAAPGSGSVGLTGTVSDVCRTVCQ